jgi:hypothetical protein
MKTTTKILLAIVFCFSLTGATAQLLFKPNTDFCNAMQQVVNDFPNQLKNITGGLLEENVESKNYSSKVSFPGTESCVVTQYNSKKNKNRSWQAVLPEVESFTAAKKQYHDLFLQVKNWGIKLPGNVKLVKPNGKYDEPKEEKKFAGSLFSIIEADGIYKDVKIEVSMQYLISGWQVGIYVYDKKEDNEITPDSETTANDY